MLNKILDQKVLINTLLIAVLLGGILSYIKLGKLEDAEIAIKSAVVITPYPGASTHEVELEVTDMLEKQLQKLENIDNIESRSMPGMSMITVNIDSKVSSSKMNQMWDHLRRKVNDVKGNLPQGAQEPIVNDDFGDVYGIFVAITGDGYEYREFYNYVDFLRRELLDVEGVRRVEMFGTEIETVEVLFSAEKLATLNISPLTIVQAMYSQGQVVNPGSIISGTDRVRLDVGNKYSSLEEVEETLIQIPNGGSFKLGDIAEVKASFYAPKREALLYNGERAISLAISVESGVNVIEIGENFDKKLAELKPKLPAGIEINSVFSQPERVAYSIDGFIINLAESVLIVIVVLLFAMGLRSGLLIASGLVFTILATFIVMLVVDIQLQRISLAAIIVAMGMLVDNSIVIADGILIDLKKGLRRKEAFTSIVKRTAMPLLGATAIAVLAFLPLAMSPDGAGEYLKSLFMVLAISLLLSWVFAMIQTPYMASIFFAKRTPKGTDQADEDPYTSPFYQKLKNTLVFFLSKKYLFTISSLAVLVASFFLFPYIKFQFMPLLDYNQFVVEYKLPKGADIAAVEKDLKHISDEINQWDGIINVTAAAGRTPARYTLIRPMATGGANYGELIVDVKDFDASVILGDSIVSYINQQYPQAETRKRFYGPIFTEYEIEAEFSGPDPAVLRQLADKAKQIMRNEPTASAVTDNWKNKVKVLSPEYSVEQGGKFGISRGDVANAVAVATDGLVVGVMYEGSQMLPIKLKLDRTLGDGLTESESIPVWGLQSRSSVPLGQVTKDIQLKWEDEEIFRYNGKRSIRAQCDPATGHLTANVQAKITPAIEAIELPDGYTLTWRGSLEKSQESQRNLFSNLPLALGIMLIIVVALFNNFKQTIIVFAVFPFALLGIVIGFISTGAVLTFIGIIGALGLIGMMTKNTIVLLDEIQQNLNHGQLEKDAIVNAVLSRMRPVFMASATTVLGMIPLLWDVMFQSMAITIIFGLLVGTLITLVVVPVLYAVIFGVKTELDKTNP